MANPTQIQMQVIMTMDPLTGSGDLTVQEALKMMDARKIHHLPITHPTPDGGKELVGIVTQRDLLHATSVFLGTKAEDRKDRMTLNIHLKGFIKKKVHTLPPDAPVTEGLHLMLGKRIGCIPIVEKGDRLVGIVTQTDMLKLLADFIV